MNKKSLLKPEELVSHQQKLLSLKNNLLARNGETNSLFESAQNSTSDVMDRADGTETLERTAGEIDRDSKRLRDIESALAHIREGIYGICQMCEKPIKKARLEVLPDAAHCLDCQIQAEKVTSRA